MLIGVFGKMGSGKTLIMSILGYLFQPFDIPVYSNYDLERSLPVRDIDSLLKINNGIICLDEFWITMDARSWKDNIFLTRWINQTRKKNLLVFYTIQSFRQIDIRVRHGTDLLIFCEKLSNVPYFRYTFIDGDSSRILKSFKLDYSKSKEFYNIYLKHLLLLNDCTLHILDHLGKHCIL